MSLQVSHGVLDQRRSGVLLHAASLQGLGGLDRERGAIGAAARRFIDWLAEAGFTVWQLLPLGPTGPEGTPYWVRSDMAAEVSFIDRGELPDLAREHDDYTAFCRKSALWLEDFVLFEELTGQLGGPWWQWPAEYRHRDVEALARFAQQTGPSLEQRRIEQWYFDWQWRALRRHAATRGVYLFGDLPIYVAPDSAATWSHRQQFQLDADGKPALLSGVPPDYFSADGQLWGNPVYDWAQAERDQFSFWRRRLGEQLRRYDLVRIDHFRGLADYWGIPAAAKTAREGKWYPARGEALFDQLCTDFPVMPVVAEDLGSITADVDALRKRFGFPGMRVLQFAFDGGPNNPHLPHNHTHDSVIYTGTHDNDTTVGWWNKRVGEGIERVQCYLNSDRAGVIEFMKRACLASVGQLAILPMQDLLGLDSAARLNTPGTTHGNWSWKLPAESLTSSLAQQLRRLNLCYGRLPEVVSENEDEGEDREAPNGERR
jgi:4-alpha-glucanotransferase